MARRRPGVTPHLLEHHHTDFARRLVDLLQPRTKAQPDHAAALEPAGAELVHTAGNRAVAVAHGPAGALAEIEGEDRHWRWYAAGKRLERRRSLRTCIKLPFGQSRYSHENLHRGSW
jgi:hypothetical protein